MATSVRPAVGAMRASARAAAPSARCSASAARSAAWSLPTLSPPSSAAIAALFTRAASRSGAPRTSSTAALAAAIVAPQPEASKPASATRSPATATPQVDEVAAGRAAGRAGVRSRGGVPTPAGVAQVFGKSLVRHSQPSMRESLSGPGPFHPMMGTQ